MDKRTEMRMFPARRVLGKQTLKTIVLKQVVQYVDTCLSASRLDYLVFRVS